MRRTEETSEKCNMCGGLSALFTRIAGERGLFYRCSACGLIWLAQDEQPIDDRAHYDTGYYADHYTGRKNTHEAFADRLPFIERYVPAGASILEVGAAAGDFLSVLDQQGFNVRGVELSARAVALAKKDHGYKLFHGTLFEAKFPDGSFDAIVSYHVLEHVPDPQALLREMYRVLKPGGSVVIEVPHATGIDARFSRRLLKSILDYPHHRFAFSPRVLRLMARTAGFRVVTVQASPSFLLTQAARRLLGYGMTKEKTAHQKSVNTHKIAKKSAKSPLRAKSCSIFYRLAGCLLPGMRLTIIARKDT
ncbi:MAG: class I SAM-dependent methyltransferase [bacterium]|nr:class I SAM-dependent methyltransferase [bacterium]